MSVARGFGLNLPDYPWNSLAPYRRTAQEHPDGVVDLSIGTPVDPTPLVVQDALAAAAAAHAAICTSRRFAVYDA